MKKKIALLVIYSATMLFTACGDSNASHQATANEAPATQAVEAMAKVPEVDQPLDGAEALAGKQIEVEGISTHDALCYELIK